LNVELDDLRSGILGSGVRHLELDLDIELLALSITNKRDQWRRVHREGSVTESVPKAGQHRSRPAREVTIANEDVFLVKTLANRTGEEWMGRVICELVCEGHRQFAARIAVPKQRITDGETCSVPSIKCLPAKDEIKSGSTRTR
jgi:hypothetical protein